MESNLLYPKSTDLNVNLILKVSPQKHIELCFTKYLGAVAQPN